jgi:chromosome segregation ATPase
MLHAAWDRLTLEEQERLSVLLEEGFAMLPENHELRSRIKNYEASNPASRIPELYAILGTEIAVLPTELEEHYRNYFDDRGKSVQLAEQFYAVFETLVEERDALVGNLESRATEIEDLKFTYEEAAAVLRQDVLAFNEKAATPGGFPSLPEFEATRDLLLERQSRLEDLRKTLMEKIDAYNELLEDLTRLNTELSELNRGINITLEVQEELEPDGALVEDG